MFTGQLLIGTAMIAVTVVVHILGMAGLIEVLRRRIQPMPSIGFMTMTQTMVASVLGVFLLHTIEIWCWAILFIGLGEFDGLESALYFSTVTFTTLGYGDIVLQDHWRLLSAFEAANGIILFGVSTAFVFALIQRFYRTVSDNSKPR